MILDQGFQTNKKKTHNLHTQIHTHQQVHLAKRACETIQVLVVGEIMHDADVMEISIFPIACQASRQSRAVHMRLERLCMSMCMCMHMYA
jgi:hypothetical protein